MKTHWICDIVCYLLLQWFHWPFSSESTIPQNWVKALPLWQVFTPRPQPHRGFPILIQLVLLSHKFRNEIPSVPSIHALFWGFFFLSIWYYIFFCVATFFPRLLFCFVGSRKSLVGSDAWIHSHWNESFKLDMYIEWIDDISWMVHHCTCHYWISTISLFIGVSTLIHPNTPEYDGFVRSALITN